MTEQRMFRLQVMEPDAAGGSAPSRRRPVTQGRTLTVSLDGPSGHRVEARIPVSELDTAGLDAQGLLLKAVEYGGRDLDGSAEDVARRRAFLQGLPDQIASACMGADARYMIMQPDSETGNRPVHPHAPIELSRVESQDIHTHFVIAPYHVGG